MQSDLLCFIQILERAYSSRVHLFMYQEFGLFSGIRFYTRRALIVRYIQYSYGYSLPAYITYNCKVNHRFFALMDNSSISYHSIHEIKLILLMENEVSILFNYFLCDTHFNCSIKLNQFRQDFLSFNWMPSPLLGHFFVARPLADCLLICFFFLLSFCTWLINSGWYNIRI